MEVIIFFVLILVIATKGFTTQSLHALETNIRAAQSEETEISQRLQSTESSLRALEKEHKVLGQELKHLENDKDLATLEVAKAGGKPITDEQLKQLLDAAAQPRNTATKNTTTTGSEVNISEGAPPTGTEPETDTETENPKRSQTKTTDGQSKPNANEIAASGESNKRSRILVVDDNDELRALLLQALGKDYDVLEAPDGFEALSQILKQKEKYDLVITDLNMPKVNGIRLVENLPEGIPTIIISAFLNKPEFKKALSELQISSVLEKPFQIATLRAAVQEALKASKPTEPAIST